VWDDDEQLGARVAAKLERDPRIDALAAWPFPDSMQYFLSGSNEAPEIYALSQRGLNIGVAVPELSAGSMEALAQVVSSKVFVDSGAFSEVDFSTGAPRWPKPITDAQWQQRLARYLAIAQLLGHRAYLVTPDKVADQDGTLERLSLYAPVMAQCAAYGARLLVPVQKGPQSMAAFYRAEAAVLRLWGVPEESFYPAIPLKKDATKLSELLTFARSLDCNGRHRPRIHLLGRGVFSPDYRETFNELLKVCPDFLITSDSVHSRSSGFLGNRAHPGPYMRAMDMLRGMGLPTFEVKRVGMHIALDQEDRMQLIEAVEAGWYDSELFDSAAEHYAWLAAHMPS
jgi:hypothetical protein